MSEGASTPMQLGFAVAGLRAEPSRDAEQWDQLLFGERFDVALSEHGWSHGRARRDGYEGWVRSETLIPAATPPTHWVRALRTFAFVEPNIKTRPLHRLSMNALVAVEAVEGRFARVEGSGWVAADQLGELGRFADDPAAVAQRYLGAPYLWGGRDSLGLDCSGLVQQALYACGRACPRNSGDQAKAVGAPLPPDGLEGLKRNDLVFWRGHVGIMLDADTLLHANAQYMRVEAEPLETAVARSEAAGSGRPVALRRL